MTDSDLLRRWACDTWRSFVAMTDPATGLPTDHIGADLDPDTPQWLHLTDQHRWSALEHGRRARPRDH
jgi:hypothetical protein